MWPVLNRFQTPVTTQNLVGMLLTFTGLWLYTTAKSESKKGSHQATLPISVTVDKRNGLQVAQMQQGGVLHRNDSELVLSYER